ncbi:MAG: mannose-1-phosphate guanylyltransferase [Moraxellaceae bacterium]|nr:MAG: mannose-1-phosphate guanylyltransferase [Moraxellaceae bacterium]
MKAMLLAAGRGERMGALSAHCPKPLLKVAGKPLIEHQIERLVAAGFSEIVINVCYLADQIIDYLADGSRWGAVIQYSKESECLETGGGIYQALPLLSHGGEGSETDDEPFLVVNGDVWTDFPLANLASGLRESDQQAHLVLVPNPSHNMNGDFCFVAQDDFQKNVQVRAVTVKAGATGRQSYTFSGMSVLRPGLFAGYTHGKFALAPLLTAAMAQQKVVGEIYAGAWVDVGTPERLDFVNKH